MAGEAKVHIPIHWALSCKRIGPILLTNAWCSCCSFWCISLICWAYFSDVIVLPWFIKLYWIKGQQTTKQWSWHFLMHVWLWDMFYLFLGSTGCCQLWHKVHFWSHVTIHSRNSSLLLCRIKEDDTAKLQFFFYFWSAHEATIIEIFHLSSLLQMPNDCRMVDEFLGSFTYSWKRFSFNDPLNWFLSTSDGQPLHSSSSKLSSPLQNFLKYHCTVCSLAKCVLMLWVVSAALRPILNSNKKRSNLLFCLTSFLV